MKKSKQQIDIDKKDYYYKELAELAKLEKTDAVLKRIEDVKKFIRILSH